MQRDSSDFTLSRLLRDRRSLLAALALIFLGSVVTARTAAAQADSLPRTWGMMGVGTGPLFTVHQAYYTSWSVVGRVGAGVRVGSRLAIRAEASYTQPRRVGGDFICNDATSGTQPSSCDLPAHPGPVAAGVVSLAYLAHISHALPRLILFAGPAVYHLGSDSQERRAFVAAGMSAGVEQMLLSEGRQMVSITIGATVLANVQHDVLWVVPLGLDLRFW